MYTDKLALLFIVIVPYIYVVGVDGTAGANRHGFGAEEVKHIKFS